MVVVDRKEESHEGRSDLERVDRGRQLVAHRDQKLSSRRGKPFGAVSAEFLQHAAPGAHERLVEAQDVLPAGRDAGSAARAAAHDLLDERAARKIREGLNRLPGRLVTHARAAGGFRNRPHVRHAAKDVEPLVNGLVQEVREQHRIGLNIFLRHACLPSGFLAAKRKSRYPF